MCLDACNLSAHLGYLSNRCLQSRKDKEIERQKTDNQTERKRDRITLTNKMHYFLLIYFNNKPLHVSSRLAAHHQEEKLCINSNWYSHAEK